MGRLILSQVDFSSTLFSLDLKAITGVYTLVVRGKDETVDVRKLIVK